MWMYRLLLTLAAPVIYARLLWRGVTGRESRGDIAERFGRRPEPQTTGETIWLHAASNGELQSAKSLISLLLQQRPDLTLLITCNSVTGKALVKGWALPRVTVQLAPLDFRRHARALLARYRVKALLIIENELWPNRIAVCHSLAIPVALIGARLSSRSARMWQRFGMVSLFERIQLLSAQDAASESRFLTLGVPDKAQREKVNLKAAYEVDASQLSDPLYPRAHMLLAASTHPGEDALTLEAYGAARQEWPELRLILAPRHPRRAEDIKAIIEGAGLSCSLRSEGAEPDGSTDVFLADTLGEMDRWYHAAALCFVGGSFVDVGGHTPFEPASHGCALVHGPYVANFQDVYDALHAMEGAVSVASSVALKDAVIRLKDTAHRHAVAQNAQGILLTHDSLQNLTESLLDLAYPKN